MAFFTASRTSSLAAFKDRHAGGTIVVCGCGRSLHDLPEPTRWITIGVNDVGRLFDPTYLVVLNPKNQFAADRFRYVADSRAKALFTQLDSCALPIDHPNIVRFRLGLRGGTSAADDALPYTRNSPYVAVCVAAFMGAKRIGLIGVDFTDHHFFGNTGRHALTGDLATIVQEYGSLAGALARDGVELFNLSAQSRLEFLRKLDPVAFLAGATSDGAAGGRAAARTLNIVSYATTPIAGVPAILARCISARTPHRARCVWATRSYGNGVVFDGDIEWTSAPRAAQAALADADVVIVHNGKVAAPHEAVLAQKPVVTMAHNYMWNVDARFVARGAPGVVVGQYQATLPEFAGWAVVPNPMPLWELPAAPEKSDAVTICYTPSGKHERYPDGHRLYWHAKGYDTTMRVLDRLAAHYAVRLDVVRHSQVSHTESLAMKQRAHVVIDECATGSYHRNSLEGLAAGCVVVNGLGILPEIVTMFRRCAQDAADLPFTFARLDDLEPVLTMLVNRGSDPLAAEGRVNGVWMKRHWDFAAQWERFWWPAVSASLEHSPRRTPSPVTASSSAGSSASSLPARRPAVMQVAKPRLIEEVSVVVPHGGADRLPQLTATLAGLRRREGVGEIIVSEMGPAAVAMDTAKRWADKYVFTRHEGEFERARALNVGSGIAACALVLWNDNDLVAGPDFVARAARELQDRRFDYLIPYSTVKYLSEGDSQGVMIGARNPADCVPDRVWYSGTRRPTCSGGMGLVRRDFLVRYGGFIEGFLGWGGEDNAWNRKVALLGSAGSTARVDQDVYHLFHASSFGYGRTAPGAHNPHYMNNVWLLNRVSAIRDARQFLQEFPPPAYRSCPWDRSRLIVVLTSEDPTAAARGAAIADGLRTMYEVNVETAALSECHDWRKRCAAADALLAVGAAPITALAADQGDGEIERSLAVLDEAEALPCDQWSNRQIRLSSEGADTPAAVLNLVGPLSTVLGGVASSSVSGRESIHVEPTFVVKHDACPSPVWVYWEGECPEWIDQCRRTISAHAPDVRQLSPGSFDALRDTDRDIDLSRLRPAQRADFIRAFLLARYGGLWIDADCIVMQPVTPVLDLLQDHDFVAHRERSGYVSNGFIGAKAGSRNARALYDRLCGILRSRRPLGWISLGGQPLTELLNGGRVPWFELPCEQIQPVCWSNPDAFFVEGAESVHERAFSESALCYMLSNTEITKRLKAKGGLLTRPDTFFTFLINRSLARARRPNPPGAPDEARPRPRRDASEAAALKPVFAAFVDAYRRYGDESLSGPGSGLAQTSEMRKRLPLLIADLGIRSLLDAPCGDFHWMRTLRLGIDQYIGVDFLETVIANVERRYGAADRRFLCLDLRTDPLPATDCIFSRDCLVHLSHVDIFAVLRNFKQTGARYLLTTTFTSQRSNPDTSLGRWRPLNLEQPPFNFPRPMRIINEKCSEAGRAYWDKSLGLWALDDVVV